MTSEDLAKRINDWQIDASTAGHIGEHTVGDLLKKILPSDEYLVEVRGKKCNVRKPKPMKGSFRLDIAITCIKTNKTILVEVKKQHARGNAHERAYKFLPNGGITNHIRSKLMANYYPVIIIFSGEMASCPKYMDEIAIQYAPFPGIVYMHTGNIDAFTTYVNNEIVPRINGIKSDYNDVFDLLDIEMKNEKVDDMDDVEYDNMEDEEGFVIEATNENVKNIIAAAGSVGISKIDIRKKMTTDPTSALLDLRDANAIRIVSGNKRGAKWALVQDQTMQLTGT